MRNRTEDQIRNQIGQIENRRNTRTDAQTEIHLTLIRHGVTLFNKEGRYLGKTDKSLSRDGIQTLEKAATDGTYPAAGLLFSGPMKRCLETAQILYPGQTPILIPEWTEMDFGAFEGHNYKELSGDPAYQNWIDSGGTLPFPEGESREAFIRRSVAGYENMLNHMKIVWKENTLFVQCNRSMEQGEPEAIQCDESKAEDAGTKNTVIRNVSAVVHGGTIMALLSHFLGGEYFDYQVKCGQGYSGRLVFPTGEGTPEWREFRPLSELRLSEFTEGETWG